MLQGVESGEAQAVHHTRVASRRIRELLPVLQIDPGTTHKLSKRLRKVTRALGVVRDADVLLGLLDELQQAGRPETHALQRVAQQIRGERDKAGKRASGKSGLTDLRRVSRKLERVARDLQHDGETRRESRAWRWALEARVARRARILADAIERAGAVYLPERLHEVRIAVKKLRYAVELSADASGVRDRARLRTLRQGQDLLGRLHDWQVLIDRTRQVQGSLKPPNTGVSNQLDALVMELEHHCRRLHARYMSQRLALAAVSEKLGVEPSSAARRAG
jgi:CHAD domain-containing protein